MESCNKDEASKLKLISEQKLNENDFAVAKEFALKAQALYPGMDGLSQLVILINIYVSAEEKVGKCGEVDWYGVLGVTPTADDETIKKQYHKIALMIHPDKNKNSRADGAFKLVLEAWNLLSDKAKRRAYDQRRWIQSVPPHVRSDHTFLTDCETCRKRQEHHRIFQGKVVICCHCGQPFKANQISRRLRNFDNMEPLPNGTSTNDELFHGTFAAECQTCNTLQEHLRIYEGKIIRCSYCSKPFQANNVGPHTNLPSWMDKDPTLSTFFSDCGTCRTRQKLPRKFLGTIVVCSHCRQSFKANVSAVKLRNFDNIEPLPAGTSTNDELFHGTFVAECQTCNTLQEHLRIYEGKTIRCSYCSKPFQADNVSPHTNLPSWMDKDPALSTFFSDCGTCQTRQKLPRKLLGMVIVCSNCRQPFKASVSAIRLGNSSDIRPLPSGTSEIEELFYGTFVIECQRCMVHQKQLKIEDKTIHCSYCGQPFQANAAHQQDNNVGVKRAREEPQGDVGGGWDRRDNVRARAS